MRSIRHMLHSSRPQNSAQRANVATKIERTLSRAMSTTRSGICLGLMPRTRSSASGGSMNSLLAQYPTCHVPYSSLSDITQKSVFTGLVIRQLWKISPIPQVSSIGGCSSATSKFLTELLWMRTFQHPGILITIASGVFLMRSTITCYSKVSVRSKVKRNEAPEWLGTGRHEVWKILIQCMLYQFLSSALL